MMLVSDCSGPKPFSAAFPAVPASAVSDDAIMFGSLQMQVEEPVSGHDSISTSNIALPLPEQQLHARLKALALLWSIH